MKILKQVQDDKICSTQSGFYRTEMFLVIIIDPATSQDDKQVKNKNVQVVLPWHPCVQLQLSKFMKCRDPK